MISHFFENRTKLKYLLFLVKIGLDRFQSKFHDYVPCYQFIIGDSGELLYGPGNLLDKDVIFVSMNYRLGIFGFLTLGDESLPGNLGMISFLVCIYIRGFTKFSIKVA